MGSSPGGDPPSAGTVSPPPGCPNLGELSSVYSMESSSVSIGATSFVTGATSSCRGGIGHAAGVGAPSIWTPDEVETVESNTVNDPAPDDDVALDLCDFFDLVEVELFSIKIE